MTPDDFLRLIDPEEQGEVLRRLDSHLSGDAPYFECGIVTKGGDTRWVRCYGKVIRNEVQGRIVRIYGAAQDITDYKQREQSLEQRVGELSLELEHIRDQ